MLLDSIWSFARQLSWPLLALLVILVSYRLYVVWRDSTDNRRW